MRQVVTADNNTGGILIGKIVEQNHTHHQTDKLNQLND
jgi:hypothetical protein